MPIPQTIKDLITRFTENQASYSASTYNETQLRREFLDPFFEALGWDVANKQGYAEAYKEVIHEDAVKIGTATKAPDYSFRVGGTRKFFVEAKKPFINIKDDIDPAFQLRRYAWSAKLPLSILTDFQEFAVYDCRVKPVKTDKASIGRILYIKYDEFEKRWDEIASIFSKDSILKGSFDRFVTNRAKKGTTEVDNVFLSEIENWRDILARNIAIRNENLSTENLNFAVQRTIDRLIFLRICEDRGIEDYGRLQAHLNGENVYKRLCVLFREADERYNSGLFHFREEKGREETPDNITLKLDIDDKVLKQIIQNLYYPDSAYEFSVLPADILGQVYEQFLGKVIRLTAGHQAKIEDKPEVKKAGGVFYTPTYIVDYIVKNTVGKLLEGITPKKAATLRILDPACGSGSFLIGAYQYLLDWYRDWYTKNDPEKWLNGKTPAIYKARAGEYRLSTPERKKILLNNIYGVDIDTQAVEVTKLSLLLKVLEGENEQSIAQQLKLFHERALPDLGNNIKCGNSLIGTDYFQTQGVQETMALYRDEENEEEKERNKINAFDWEGKDGFAEIIKNGGFDAVIGNPPYIPIESMSDGQRNYYQKHFPQLERKFDSSIIFILSQLAKLNSSGLLGYISSLTWQTGENFSRLREHVFNNFGVVSLLNLPFDVFKNAYVDTGVYILSKKSTKSYRIYRFPKKTSITNLNDIHFQKIPTKLIQPPDFKVILDPVSAGILQRLLRSPGFTSLGELTISTQGLAGNMFELSTKPKKDFYPFLESGQVYRYAFIKDNIAFTDMQDKSSLRPFYEAKPKLLIRRVINRQDRLMCAFTDEKIVFKKDINPFILNSFNKDQTYFLVGILNSKLFSYLYVNISSIATKDDFRQTTLAELRKIPIPKFDDMANKDRYSKILSLVISLIDLNKRLPSIKNAQEKTILQRQIDSTDRRIDELVYELYGLTEQEIKIVEESSERK